MFVMRWSQSPYVSAKITRNPTMEMRTIASWNHFGPGSAPG